MLHPWYIKIESHKHERISYSIIFDGVNKNIDRLRRFLSGDIIMRTCPMYEENCDNISKSNVCRSNNPIKISDEAFLRATKKRQEFLLWRFERAGILEHIKRNVHYSVKTFNEAYAIYSEALNSLNN